MTTKNLATIAILPLGLVPAADLEFCAETIQERFGTATLLMPAIQMPASFWNHLRQQWDADQILEMLFDNLPANCSRIIGVLDEDMYAAGRTFVYGYAHMRDGNAVISLRRLREGWYGRIDNLYRFHSRIERCIVHELGHTFGNPHCEDNNCVMHAVCQIDSLDALADRYCTEHAAKVACGVLIAPDSAEGIFQRGGALLRHSYTRRAVVAFQRATELSPREPRYWNDLGVVLLSLSDRKGARAAFTMATVLGTNLPHPYYNLGILCRENEGVEAAVPYFEEGLRRDSDSVAAHKYVGNLYESIFDDRRRALEHYKAYLAEGGTDDAVLMTVLVWSRSAASV